MSKVYRARDIRSAANREVILDAIELNLDTVLDNLKRVMFKMESLDEEDLQGLYLNQIPQMCERLDQIAGRVIEESNKS